MHVYYNVSRGTSPTKSAAGSATPSATAPLRASKIDLENLEEQQDVWCKTYELLRSPPPPPQLNSPRSLRACALMEVNPQTILQKLSLKQHLFRVLGNPAMLMSLPETSSTEYKVLMQSALRSFQEATIGLGTSQEKLAAYIGFEIQEELRVSHLESLREVRRQLVAEDVFVERRRHHQHHSHGDKSSRSTSATPRVSGRPSSAHSRDRHTRDKEEQTLWSSTVPEEKQSRHTPSKAHLSAVKSTTGRKKDTTAATAAMAAPLLAASLASPPRAQASPNRSPRRHVPTTQAPAVAPATAVTSLVETPPSAALHRSNKSGRDHEAAAASNSSVGGLEDFCPAPSPSGKLPYTPRDVSSLNSSYFGNRSIQSNVSNPCGAPLPSSHPAHPLPPHPNSSASANTSAVPSPAPKKPILAQKPKHGHRPTRTAQQQPQVPQHHKILFDVSKQSDLEGSLNAEKAGNGGAAAVAAVPAAHPGDCNIDSVAKQDLSIVSIDSTQLEILLGGGDPEQRTPPQWLSVTQLSAARPHHRTSSSADQHPLPNNDHAPSAALPGTQHTVKLFRASDADSTGNAKATLSGQRKSEESENDILSSAGTSHKTSTTVNVALPPQPSPTAIAPNILLKASTTTTPKSQPLTPRGRRGYTNRADTPRQLVPNVLPRAATVTAETNGVLRVREGDGEPEKVRMSSAATSPERESRAALEPTSPPTMSKRVASEALSSPETPVHPPLPPPSISPLELQDGFLYYCANPVREVTTSHFDARFPLPSVVQL